jgi:hypothetical protein
MEVSGSLEKAAAISEKLPIFREQYPPLDGGGLHQDLSANFWMTGGYSCMRGMIYKIYPL